MHKRVYIAIILTFILLFNGCTKNELSTPDTTVAENETTNSETMLNEPSSVTTTSPAVTASLHSELYLPQYSTEEIITYFEEVVLNMEYTFSGENLPLVHKWNSPIIYRIYGTPTQEDLNVLNDLFTQLNAIPGFPGIREVTGDEKENLTLSFLNKEDFYYSFPSITVNEDAYGATHFWYYDDTYEIYTADIGYRTDIDQNTRNSILIEEIINTLGISDTTEREDSIVYQYSDDNLTLSDVDLIILKLLYNPSIRSNMNSIDCREAIEKLYY